MQRRAWTFTLLALAALLSQGCADQLTSTTAAPAVAQLPKTIIIPRLTSAAFLAADDHRAAEGTTFAETSRPAFTTIADEERRAEIKSADFQILLPQGSFVTKYPMKARFKMNYVGTNAKQAMWYNATPLYSGSAFTGSAELLGPGTCIALAGYVCGEYSFNRDVDVHGISCGYNVGASSRHVAWLADNLSATVNLAQFGSLTLRGVDAANTAEVGFHRTAYGVACPTVGSTCPDTGTVYVGDDDASGGSDFNRTPNVRPSFDCTTDTSGDTETDGNDGSYVLVEVCITYISGFVDLETGKIEITSTYTQCWIEKRTLNATNRVPAGEGLSFSQNAATGVPIVLIGTGALPGGEPARIVRRRRGEKHDAILVDLTKATPVDLESAIVGLLALRSGTGEVPKEDFEGVVSVSNLGPHWSTRDLPRVAAQLEQLRNAPERQVAGIGRGRATTINVVPGSYTTVAKFQ